MRNRLPEALLWPAFAGGEELPEQLRFERGIWGKTRGITSDFAWLAVSSGLDPEDSTLARELYLGTEDEPCHAYLWRTLGGGTHCAAACYPGGTSDATGRSGSLEKQILLWHRPSGVPAAIGALLLPARVAASDTGRRWPEPSDGGTPSPPAPAENAPLEVTVESLARAIEVGRAGLAEAVGEEALAGVYATLLAGHRPAVLPDRGNLPPEALGALLVPLDRDLADRLSITSGLPSRRFHRNQIARRWDVVVTASPAPEWRGRPSPGGEHIEEGRRLARALLAGEPSLLPHRSPDDGAGLSEDDIQIALWGASSVGKTALLAQLHVEASMTSGPWEVFPTPESLKFIDDSRQASRRDNRFPRATQVGGKNRISYRFLHRPSQRRAVLFLEDRAGQDSEILHEETRQHLTSAHALLLLIDPLRDRSRLETDVQRTLDWLQAKEGWNGQRDPRPVAVCLSKADQYIRTATELAQAETSPQEFVRERLPRSVLGALDRSFERYRLFPLSAAGVRLVWGSVEPVAFYDETLTPRLRPTGRPINLLAPFTWLLDEIAGEQ